MRYLHLAAFEKHLAQCAPNHFSRVYVVAIPEDYERGQVLRLVERCLKKNGQEPLRFVASAFELRPFIEALDSVPLFGEEPILCLDGIEHLSKHHLEVLKGFLGKGLSFGYVLLGAQTKIPDLSFWEKEGVVLDLLGEKPWEKERRIQEKLLQRVSLAGKKLTQEALAFLWETVEMDLAGLEQEIDQLICYCADREVIEKKDLLALSKTKRSDTLWHLAERLVWEKKRLGDLDSQILHSLFPLLRSQLLLGAKIACLVQEKIPKEQWSQYLPKIWPKTLEKRVSMVVQQKEGHFQKALDRLFYLELALRGDSTQTLALFDRFQLQWIYDR